MKKLGLLLLFLCFAQLSLAQKCANFKTGKFEYTNPGYSGYKIIRTATTQIEYNEKTGFRAEGKIQWISDCEYMLTYTKLKSDPNKLIGKKVKVKIIRVDGTKCTFHATMDNYVLTTEIVRTGNVK